MSETGYFSTGATTVMPSGVKVTSFLPNMSRYAPTRPLTARKRVAAYARVSTDQEEQLSSYEAQVDYYTRFIKANPEWIYSGVYADEGISATNTKKRDGFNRMIADALAGKFDMIITKSVSRFARNTVDTLTTIRDLKEKGIGVVFEKENIDTLDSKGELLITIMGSLAQEESRSISENTTWGQRKRFADGKVTMPFSRFLGYDRGENGEPVINEKEAAVVRRIYRMFLEGGTPSSIAKTLTADEVPTPAGKAVWGSTTVQSILTNEKYKGDALLQKSFTTDFLTKKKKINEGEVPRYYAQGSHPAIVSREVHDLVQHEFRRRRESHMRTTGWSKTGRACFAGKLVCGDCGSFYGSKVWHSTDKYRRVIWQCDHKFHNAKAGGEKCKTPHLTEKQIEAAFVETINGLIGNKDEILAAYDGLIAELTDTSALEEKGKTAREQCQSLYARMQAYINENASKALDQDEYSMPL